VRIVVVDGDDIERAVDLGLGTGRRIGNVVVVR
jgi:hypothetical protein